MLNKTEIGMSKVNIRFKKSSREKRGGESHPKKVYKHYVSLTK